MGLWEAEHGPSFDVPTEVSDLEGIRDISWHNDTCPRFALTDDGEGPNLWVDHPDPDNREFQCHRFLVTIQHGDGPSTDDEEIYDGDDVSVAVTAFIMSALKFHQDRRFGATD